MQQANREHIIIKLPNSGNHLYWLSNFLAPKLVDQSEFQRFVKKITTPELPNFLVNRTAASKQLHRRSSSLELLQEHARSMHEEISPIIYCRWLAAKSSQQKK